jgi:hypothetical protein
MRVAGHRGLGSRGGRQAMSVRVRQDVERMGGRGWDAGGRTLRAWDAGSRGGRRAVSARVRRDAERFDTGGHWSPSKWAWVVEV